MALFFLFLSFFLSISLSLTLSLHLFIFYPKKKNKQQTKYSQFSQIWNIHMTIKRMFQAFNPIMAANPNIAWIHQNMRYYKIHQIHHYPVIKVRQVRIHHQCIRPMKFEPIVQCLHIHRSSRNHISIRHIFIFLMLIHRHRLMESQPNKQHQNQLGKMFIVFSVYDAGRPHTVCCVHWLIIELNSNSLFKHFQIQ